MSRANGTKRPACRRCLAPARAGGGSGANLEPPVQNAQHAQKTLRTLFVLLFVFVFVWWGCVLGVEGGGGRVLTAGYPAYVGVPPRFSPGPWAGMAEAWPP